MKRKKNTLLNYSSCTRPKYNFLRFIYLSRSTYKLYSCPSLWWCWGTDRRTSTWNEKRRARFASYLGSPLFGTICRLGSRATVQKLVEQRMINASPKLTQFVMISRKIGFLHYLLPLFFVTFNFLNVFSIVEPSRCRGKIGKCAEFHIFFFLFTSLLLLLPPFQLPFRLYHLFGTDGRTV